MAAERLHGDDTTGPVLAKAQDRARAGSWVYVRDDRPFGGHGPPAMFYYSRDRKGEHPQRHLAGYAGLFQADAFDVSYRAAWLYLPERRAGPISEVGCWAHARRPFFAMADIEENARRRAAGKTGSALSPIAIEVVRRIDTLIKVERSIDGKSAEERRTVRQERSKPLVEELQVYMREQRAKLSRGHDLATRPSIISSSVAPPSPCSSMTDAPACRTMLPNARCVASLSGAKSGGCSAVPIAVVSVLPQCIA